MQWDLIWSEYKKDPIRSFKKYKKDLLTVRLSKSFLIQVRLVDLYDGTYQFKKYHRCEVCQSPIGARKIAHKFLGIIYICNKCADKVE